MSAITGASGDGGARLQDLWSAVQDSVEGVLEGVTIADLAASATTTTASRAGSAQEVSWFP